MALKASFVVALLVAVVVGLMLPTPGGGKSAPTRSSFQTIELKNG